MIRRGPHRRRLRSEHREAPETRSKPAPASRAGRYELRDAHDRQLVRHDLSATWSIDVIGSAQAAIGNIYSGAELGAIVRLGYHLNARWSAKTMADIGYDANGIDANPGFFLMAGLTGRYVARDIFVDGNTWRDSHSVDRTPFVADQMLGLGMHWKRLELRVTMTRRSDQYSSQAGATRFGSVVLVWKP